MSAGHEPDLIKVEAMLQSQGQGAPAERARAVFCAVALIGQRTPEELVIVADYLLTGELPTMR